MITWHRTSAHGADIQFTYTPDERGNVILTQQEVEGLMRTGGWTQTPITAQMRMLQERVNSLVQALDAQAVPFRFDAGLPTEATR